MPVICPFCSQEFPGEKLNSRHLSICNPSSSSKVEPCLCGHISTSLTQMKRHRADCEVWKQRDKEAVKAARHEATNMELYGVANVSQSSEIQAKREATNLKRYGARNPLCKEASTFKKVQESLVGKRVGLHGEDNPFSWPEVQEKLRNTMQEKYGAPNPQQVPEIRERTFQTNSERFQALRVSSDSEDLKEDSDV